jgi:hypothetical protein
MDIQRRRDEITAILEEIRNFEARLRLAQYKIIDEEFFEPDSDAAEALAIVKRIERRLASTFMDTNPKPDLSN